MSNHIKKIKALIAGGWEFKFEPETNFIGMYHKKGGKRSVCEMSFHDKEDNILLGEHITDSLNSL